MSSLGLSRPTAPLVHGLLRRALRHRRLLASALLAGAVVCALDVLAPPRQPTVAVLVAARSLPAGSVLAASDVRVAHRPASTSPAALRSAAEALGRVLAAPVGAGEALTAQRLVGPGLATALARQGHVAAPVRLADADVANLLRTGDTVDVVLAAGTASSLPHAQVVAHARVITVVAGGSGSLLDPAS
ncbi:MAG TPA: SAF domain-containing protein, partial [Actinomycetes bacterium]|nr:SAF domain-containing protein [Actinomycetes bacterium]